MRRISAILLVAAVNTGPVQADIREEMNFHRQLGYALAAVEACHKLSINPKGVQQMLQNLDAPDQASAAADPSMTQQMKTESAALLEMLGDAACEAALDYEKKLGIDIFLDK